MTIRFAAARTGANATVLRCLRMTVPPRTANDNSFGFSDDRVLKAALRHFADHGLAAAELARNNAHDAFFAGDRQSYRWWLSICATLDRRMAAAIESRAHP